MFSPWPISDPAACLPSVYLNLSSLLSLSFCMLSLILHCCLSSLLHLSEDTPPTDVSKLLCVMYRLTVFAPFLSVFFFFRCCCSCCCSTSMSVIFTLSYRFSHLSLWMLSFPPLGCLQRLTPDYLLMSDGETLRSEGLMASQRERANPTHRVMMRSSIFLGVFRQFFPTPPRPPPQ